MYRKPNHDTCGIQKHAPLQNVIVHRSDLFRVVDTIHGPVQSESIQCVAMICDRRITEGIE